MWAALKAKAFFSVFAVYISIAGAVGFSCFILEEAFQTAMFATWQAKDAGDWRLVKKGAGLMEGINAHLKVVNYGIGWINPLSFLSYYDFSCAENYYIESLNANIFAHEPLAFIGERVTFRFKPEETERIGIVIALKARGMTVLVDRWPAAGMLLVEGKVTEANGRVTITETIIKKEE
jgi:hypothetical protein